METKGENLSKNPPINPLINLSIELSETQQEIIKLLMNDNGIKIEKVAETLKLKPNTIKKNIKQLKELGVVERQGTTRKGEWIVKIWIY